MSRRYRFMPASNCAVAACCVLAFAAPVVRAQSWDLTTGGSWATPGNWNPTTVPNAVSAIVNFPATATANRTITNDSGATGFTVGSITFDMNSTFTNSLTTGTAGSRLFLDNGGAGVTLTTMAGAGTGNNTISVPLTFNEMVTGIVNHTTASSAAGSLNLTATITGPGGFTKQGDGLSTFGTGAKTYTGPTILDGGRMRISNAARPSATSSFTINAGAQLTLITAGTYNFGSGPLNLNGAGATSGPYAVFPGAIRNDTNLAATISNAVVLQSDTLLHVEGAATGLLSLTGDISGPGGLTLTAPNSSANQGTLNLGGTNSYAGPTNVNGGTLIVAGSLTGAGAVTVNSINVGSANFGTLAGTGSIAGLVTVNAGSTNGVVNPGVVGAPIATLTMTGGATIPGTYVADIDPLGSTSDRLAVTGTLNVAGGAFIVPQATGSGGAYVVADYSTLIGTFATTTLPTGYDIYYGTFSGAPNSIVIAPVPEPTHILLLCGAAAGGARWWRRKNLRACH